VLIAMHNYLTDAAGFGRQKKSGAPHFGIWGVASWSGTP